MQAPCPISILFSDYGLLRDAVTFFVPFFRERVTEFRRGGSRGRLLLLPRMVRDKHLILIMRFSEQLFCYYRGRRRGRNHFYGNR